MYLKISVIIIIITVKGRGGIRTMRSGASNTTRISSRK
jgi:hypothetical protein